MNKKGSIGDFLFITILIVVIFAILIIFGIVFMNVSTKFKEATAGTVAEEPVERFADNLDRWHPITDVAIVLFLVAMLIGTVIGGYLIGGSPIFLLIYIVQCAVLTFVILSINEAVVMFIEQISSYLYIYGYPISSWVMSKLVYIIIGFEVLLGIALYMKPKQTMEGLQ